MEKQWVNDYVVEKYDSVSLNNYCECIVGRYEVGNIKYMFLLCRAWRYWLNKHNSCEGT